MKSEHRTQDEIRLAASDYGLTLFRNNVGTGICGKFKRISKHIITSLSPGDYIVHQGRVVKFGLFKGSGDLIGWKKITITPDMLGMEIPVFANVEIKKKTGKTSHEQITFGNNVRRAGGVSIVARDAEDLR